jgi:hypothetical protein
LMFLRNDRDLGVKNGTLGTVSEINSQRIAVQLDDGRSVAFDTKDYAHVDHGYAATIHKAQGVTVNRTHVLATPGMDRHSAYVALSRHREGVALHYGKDDFADQAKLVRALSRERGKDMASDYKPEQEFAERRGITIRERVADMVRKIVPEKARSIFANFRPPLQTLPDIAAEQVRKPSPLDMQRGVERYASAVVDMQRMTQRGLDAMPHQQAALEKAHQALEAIQPKSGSDLAAAFARQPQLVSEAANGRTANAIRAMQLEAEIRTNPQMRADRFVENWQGLHRQRQHLLDNGDHDRARSVTSRMSGMAKGLERDAQVDSLLRNRRLELGLNPDRSGGISHQLNEYLGRGRTIGMGR